MEGLGELSRQREERMQVSWGRGQLRGQGGAGGSREGQGPGNRLMWRAQGLWDLGNQGRRWHSALGVKEAVQAASLV